MSKSQWTKSLKLTKNRGEAVKKSNVVKQKTPPKAAKFKKKMSQSGLKDDFKQKTPPKAVDFLSKIAAKRRNFLKHIFKEAAEGGERKCKQFSKTFKKHCCIIQQLCLFS